MYCINVIWICNVANVYVVKNVASAEIFLILKVIMSIIKEKIF